MKLTTQELMNMLELAEPNEPLVFEHRMGDGIKRLEMTDFDPYTNVLTLEYPCIGLREITELAKENEDFKHQLEKLISTAMQAKVYNKLNDYNEKYNKKGDKK